MNEFTPTKHYKHLLLTRSAMLKPRLLSFIRYSSTSHSNLKQIPNQFKDLNGLYNKIQTFPYTQNTPIRIGLFNSKPSLLNTILSDPFAIDQTWYFSFINRYTTNNLIQYNDQLSKDEDDSSTTIGIPSTFLKSNNLEFYELNGERDLRYNDGCHFYINFQNGNIKNHWDVYDWSDVDGDKILNNREINSTISEIGTKALVESSANTSLYTESLQNSNILQFIKFIQDVSIQTETNLIKSIKNELILQIKLDSSISIESLNHSNDIILSKLSKWNESIHFDLQKKFKPFILEYQLKNLSWWKLYLKNDYLNYYLVRMINESFTIESFDRVNYLKGQIDSFNKDHDHGQSTKGEYDNKLTILKNEIISNEVPDLQNFSTDLILKSFLEFQLPLILLSIGGWVSLGLSAYSMGGVAILGVILGFNNVSKKWYQQLDQFNTSLFERVRLTILETNDQLIKDWEINYEGEKQNIQKKLEIIESL